MAAKPCVCLLSVTQPIFSSFFKLSDMIKISKLYLESSEVKNDDIDGKSKLLVFWDILCLLT